MKRTHHIHGVGLLILLAMVLPSCDGCGEKPAPPSKVETTRTVETEHWRMKIPAHWQERKPGVYAGPDRANVAVVVREVPLPVKLLTESVKADLQRAHPDLVLDVERGLTLGDLSAYELRGRFTSRGGKAVVLHQVVVEGGARKYILTFSVLASLYPENRVDFDRITASFRGTMYPLQAPPAVTP